MCLRDLRQLVELIHNVGGPVTVEHGLARHVVVSIHPVAVAVALTILLIQLDP